MVRRWSFINLINTQHLTAFKAFHVVGNRVVFLETLSYKKKIRRFSFMARRSWARRKHTNQWLVYYAVLSNWATDYRFFTRYTKVMLTQNLFVNSFLTYNFLILHQLPASAFIGSEYFIYSFITKKVYSYFLRYRTVNFNIFTAVKNYNLFMLTQPNVSEKLKPFTLTQLATTYQFSQNTISSPLYKRVGDGSKALLELYQLITQIIYMNNVSTYKMLVLLTLTHTI